MDMMEALGRAGVIPVVALERVEDAVPTAAAMRAGGVNVAEITFRTAAAADSIRAVTAAFPDMLVGAGTVINVQQCRQAIECGAKFIVCPGYSDAVVAYCQENHVPVLPGCVTPTEIMWALEKGLQVVKFFPANVYGGLQAMKALRGPFTTLKFVPTGGVSAANLKEYLAAPFIHAVGGSWVCAKADIAAGNFEKITALCREAMDAVEAR